MIDFIHIHQHSQFSKFDGFSSIDKIVKKAKEYNMPAVGLTDHGTVAGAITFMKACKKGGIKPIIGSEFYISRDHLAKNKEGQPDGRSGNRHLNLIAKNFTGYKNLCTLSHLASVEGYYYDPRIDIEQIAQYSEGLICTSACLSNIVNSLLSVDQYEAAKKAASTFKDIFNDDYYLEVMYHGISLEGKILPDIIKLSKELDIKLLATNDNHYIDKGDAKYHDILVCMSSNRCIKDPKRLAFPYNEFYFKSQDEMAKIFGHISESMTNTLEIAEKTDYSELKFMEDGGVMRLPKFNLPPEINDAYELLHKKSWEGLKNKNLHQKQEYKERLEMELGDIKLAKDRHGYGFDTYILLIEEVIDFARKQSIPCGIRGSGCASLILYCLGVTDVDPVKSKLIWARFLGFESVYTFLDEDFEE